MPVHQAAGKRLIWAIGGSGPARPGWAPENFDRPGPAPLKPGLPTIAIRSTKYIALTFNVGEPYALSCTMLK